MPLKKDKEHAGKVREWKTKQRTTKRTSTKKEIKIELPEIPKINYKLCIKIIGFVILLTNLILSIIIIKKLNQMNNWTLLYNWGTENYTRLNTIYWSQEYKEYIGNELNDLEKQLHETEEIPQE